MPEIYEEMLSKLDKAKLEYNEIYFYAVLNYKNRNLDKNSD